MKWLACLSLLLLALAGCRSPEKPPIGRAVYHWESTFNPDTIERQWLAGLGMQRIYLRLFDVDQELPVGVVQIPDSLPPLPLQVVPTFFLTNRTFQDFSEERSDSLVARMLRKARRQLAALPAPHLIPEWQFDCDWTEGTRAAYFGFLERMRRELSRDGAGISATIRLHQVKYADRTGVPPVDRGMLMFYNVDDVADPSTQNAILDLEVARDYLHNFEAYPLPLDLALPLFRWGVVIREGKMVRLINDLGPGQLQDSSRFLFQDPTHVEVRKSTYLDGYYLYGGDEIRLESVPASLLLEAARDLSKVMKRPEWLSFYHLNPGLIKMYSHEDLEALFAILEE